MILLSCMVVKLHTIESVYEGSQSTISKNIYIVFLSLKIDVDFYIANSLDPDEMSHFVAYHQGLQCLKKYPF